MRRQTGVWVPQSLTEYLWSSRPLKVLARADAHARVDARVDACVDRQLPDMAALPTQPLPPAFTLRQDAG